MGKNDKIRRIILGINCANRQEKIRASSAYYLQYNNNNDKHIKYLKLFTLSLFFGLFCHCFGNRLDSATAECVPHMCVEDPRIQRA